MIKRDSIRRVILEPTEDGQGGQGEIKKVYKEFVDASVSIPSKSTTVDAMGMSQQRVLLVSTNKELDEYVNARYEYSGKLFKIVRQVKSGNEYFSTLMEVNDVNI